MRSLIFSVVAACFLMIASAARADTTYDFTLTQTSGTLGSGTGSFTINTAPTGTLSDYISTNSSGDILDALSFTIGADTFNLSDATGGYGEVEFREESGVQVVDDIAYNGSLEMDNDTVRLTLVSGQLSYTVYNIDNAVLSTGTIGGVQLAPAATPEPSSLALLGTGLVGAYAMLRRRRKLV